MFYDKRLVASHLITKEKRKKSRRVIKILIISFAVYIIVKLIEYDITNSLKLS